MKRNVNSVRRAPPLAASTTSTTKGLHGFESKLNSVLLLRLRGLVLDLLSAVLRGGRKAFVVGFHVLRSKVYV
jgi:hypothetical protein